MTVQNAPAADDANPHVSLVPIDETGAVAVFAPSAETARAALNLFRPEPSSTAMAIAAFDRTVDALGATGAAAAGASSAVTALASLQGVVQLAPETLALLNSGHHLMQSVATGQQMGTVVANASSGIVANAQFVPLGTAMTVATVAASLGPAVALAAIQFQLNRLENLLGEIKLITRSLLTESRTDRWAEVEARIDRIYREVGWVMELGTVPAHMIDNVATDAVALHAFALSATEMLSSRVRDLSGNVRAKERRAILESTAQAITRDAVDLHLAANAWLAVETLRSFHIQQDLDPVSSRYAELVYQHAVSTAETWRSEANTTLRDVQQLLSRISAEEPGLLNRHDRRTTPLARQMSKALTAALPDMEPPRLHEPSGTPGLDRITAVAVLQEARWSLDPGATIEALVGVSLNGEPGFRLETTDQVLIARNEVFLASGEAVALVVPAEEDAALAAAGIELNYDEPDHRLKRRAEQAKSAAAAGIGRGIDAARRKRDHPKESTTTGSQLTN